ncbi:bifunctional 3'-5' exonuclease/DNA polymerase [Arthrobacter sulfonylureivorans]|uniref:bifunctional 3'-5' exonuclease/DNA polymerase n=1 Tax=Arthrobacter sulfonylureivorans TaxID=2486855 RepID=UPI0039E487E4
MFIVLASAARNVSVPAGMEPAAYLQRTDAQGAPAAAPVVVPAGKLPETVRNLDAEAPRWVFESTRDDYLPLLAAGAGVDRSHDLALVRSILSLSVYAPDTEYIRALREKPLVHQDDELPRQLPPLQPSPDQFTLFDAPQASGTALEDLVAELQDQLAAVAASPQRGRLQLLLAAESAGALIAAEMEHSGVPWSEDIHLDILSSHLGARPREGQRPEKLENLAIKLGQELANPNFSPDSPQQLIRALHRAGIEVKTTSSWELKEHSHPAIEPLLQYRKLSRLFTANGWTWLDAWVRDGRFRPEYVVGGVVTGRWASRGGGALQIPGQIRDAVRPDPGRKLIVADAAQLEPRVLAALAQDSALAAAGRGKDLYQGIADVGFGGDRAKAKIAMLGAMYGATTGESGRLMPQLTRTYPKAIAVVERAARAGEAGQVVSSYLGRSCPPPSDRWLAAQRTTTAEEQRRADGLARSRGRFTRNFVVQSTAAEWALCWLAELRRRLRACAAEGSPVGEMVFFLHDEVMLHVREDRTEVARRLVEESAAAATRLVFGRIPVDFPVSVAVVDSYADAK